MQYRLSYRLSLYLQTKVHIHYLTISQRKTNIKAVVIIKFEWLKEYKQLEHEIALLEWKLSKSKLELTRWVEGDLMNVRLTNESLSSKLEQIIKKLEEELAIKRKQMDELMQIINRLDELDQKIIKCRYIQGMTFEKIGEEVGYSESHVRYRHNMVREALEFLSNYQDEITVIKSDTPD